MRGGIGLSAQFEESDRLGMTQMGKSTISFECILPRVIILAWVLFSFSITTI